MVKNFKIQEPHGINIEDHYHGLKYTQATINSKPWINTPGFFSSIACGIIFWILTVGCLIVGIVGTKILSDSRNAPEDSCDSYSYYCYIPVKSDPISGTLMQIFGFTFFGVFYIGAIFRFFFAYTFSVLGKIRRLDGSESINGYIHSQMNCQASLTVDFECYHNVTQSYTDSQGNVSYRTIKTVTSSDTVEIPIVTCHDISKPLVVTDLTKLDTKATYLQVNFERNWIPLDVSTSAVIKTYVDYLTLVNENKDELFNISLNVDYKGTPYKNNLLFSTSVPDGQVRSISWYHSRWIYFLSYITLTYIIYDILFDGTISSSKFVFIKTIRVDKPFVTTFILPENKVQHIIHPQIQVQGIVNIPIPGQPNTFIQPYPSQAQIVQQPYYQPQQGYPQQQGYPPQQGYPQQQGYPPQQGYPQQGYPPQQYYYPPPPHGYQQPIQMETFNSQPPPPQQQ